MASCGARVCKSSQAPFAAPWSSDRELVFQPVGAAAVLLPDELEPTALHGQQIEFDKGVGRNGLVEIDAEHLYTSIAASKSVDDLARDHPALLIVAQAGLHL